MNKIVYEVAQARSGEWRVEAIGPDGEIHVTLFCGPDGEARAKEYADWKNAETPSDKWLLWSHDENAWWKDDAGYTHDPREFAIYDRSEIDLLLVKAEQARMRICPVPVPDEFMQ